MTIITGRLVGLQLAPSAEYSFLASIPIMLGVSLKLFSNSNYRAYLMMNFSVIIISNIVAFIIGILAIGFLIRYLSNHGLAIFGWYRIGLATIIGLMLLIQ